MATPRSLDPKFVNAEATDSGENVDQPIDAKESRPEDEVPMIVHVERFQDGSVTKTRQHGPMPVSEWAAYEKEHGF
jgi:hypothetical protein